MNKNSLLKPAVFYSDFPVIKPAIPFPPFPVIIFTIQTLYERFYIMYSPAVPFNLLYSSRRAYFDKKNCIYLILLIIKE
jgi:hypothetical protein